LLQGQAVAISRSTGIYALLFSGLSRRKTERGGIGVTRIECSRTQGRKQCEDCDGDGKRPLATSHGQPPWVEKRREFGLQQVYRVTETIRQVALVGEVWLATIVVLYPIE
jgi:hypothetical protein